MPYDVFISHASEDKDSFVAPLAQLLADIGVSVWFDTFSLNVGDSLSRSIDKGLADSRYGIVVISRHFMSKPWPEYEIRGLISKEIGSDKVILPIWYGVTREEVLAFSPPLADKVAHVTSGQPLAHTAVTLLEIIRPDLHASLVRLKVAQELLNRGTLAYAKGRDLHDGPIRHPRLDDHLLICLALLYRILDGLVPTPFVPFVEAIKRDMWPEREIQIWKRMARH